METNKKKTKVTHKPHSIRFTDKAIDELKYRNNYNHRQIVRFIDGPPGITMRWTPKTNKKIFQIIKTARVSRATISSELQLVI